MTSIYTECKKIRRTGFCSAFLGGGILAAVVPIVNMIFREEMYQMKQGNPIQIMLDANWQMMAMLNVLLIVTGSCILYHIEYADNAMQKIKSLPIKESSVFWGKVILLSSASAIALAIETGAIAFCIRHWFENGNSVGELCRNWGYAFLLMQPCIVLSLIISEACKNMWISLGIGVICVFTATMLPTGKFVLSIFPFAMPFQILKNTAQSIQYIYAAIAEFAVFALVYLMFIKIRRALL